MSSKSNQRSGSESPIPGSAVPESVDTDAGRESAGSASTNEDDDDVAELSLDHIFEILKNERRRTVLHYLTDADEMVTLGELAEHVAAVENDTTVAQVTSKERKCVYVGLYQCHLPKMDDMDIVSFNQSRGRITLGPNADALYTYLEDSDSTERSWPLYYGAVGALGAGLLAASNLGASAVLTPTLVAVVALLGVSTCATLQLVTRDSDD